MGVMSPDDAIEEKNIYSVAILNLSEGGLQIVKNRKDYKGLQRDDKIILRQIIGLEELAPLADITVQIKWVMDNEYLDHVLIGACFLALHDNQRTIMQSFVNKYLDLSLGEEV